MKQLRMTIIDCCISLRMIKNILVVLGVVDMHQLLLSTGTRQRGNQTVTILDSSEKSTKLNIAGSTNSLPANVSVQLLVEALHVGVEV